jgi:hypothetical protein
MYHQQWLPLAINLAIHFKTTYVIIFPGHRVIAIRDRLLLAVTN